jgi:hypothetical protein
VQAMAPALGEPMLFALAGVLERAAPELAVTP